jgi:hypothetical protein
MVFGSKFAKVGEFENPSPFPGCGNPALGLPFSDKEIISRNTEQVGTDSSSVGIPPVSRKRKTLEFRSEIHFSEEKNPRNSVPNHFSEEKTLGIPFRTISWKRKTLGVQFRTISRKRKTLGIPFRTIFG